MPNLRFTKAATVWVVAPSLLILIGFVINLLGWNLYVYWKNPERDYIVASAYGTLHLAHAEPTDVAFDDLAESDLWADLLKDSYRDLVEIGRLHIFAERAEGLPFLFRVHRIQSTETSDYAGFEVSWLALLLILLVVALLLSGKRRLWARSAA